MEMTMQSIEQVSFRLIPGADRAGFLAHAHATEAVVRRQPGFVARMLTESEDGGWTDIVTWASHADAMAAAEAVMADPAFLPFVQMIDGPSARMSHATLVWQLK
ncbi:MAG: hypothetical protein C0524_18145 [Rhodobacter sp.]|nr:hypothetical protein [Rhodobacter sp.]